MMSRQAVVALGVALVLGLVAVFIANGYLNVKEQQAYAAGTTKVAVATSPLTYGADITTDKVRFVDYPNSSIPPGAFTSAAQLLPTGRKRVALMPIGMNEPILSSKISGPGQAASIAALLPDGMRAATVRINDVSGVAGFIQPNDSVDVLVTREMAGGDHTAQVTDVLLQNVRVMAIDQQATNADGSPKLAKTATLQVSPLDSQKLALAQEVGTLSLVLRKPGEADNPVVETVSMNDLRYNIYGGARYPAPAVVGGFGAGLANGIGSAMNGASAQIASATNGTPPIHPAIARKTAKHPQNTVQVFRGTKSDEVEVGAR